MQRKINGVLVETKEPDVSMFYVRLHKALFDLGVSVNSGYHWLMVMAKKDLAIYRNETPDQKEVEAAKNILCEKKITKINF